MLDPWWINDTKMQNVWVWNVSSLNKESQENEFPLKFCQDTLKVVGAPKMEIEKESFTSS